MTLGVCERAALAAVAWLCSAACGTGLAQAQGQAPQPPNGSSDAPVSFDIPAQPMASALNTWAVQANAQVFVDPGPVAHLTAPAVKGSLPPRQALRALLAHSNLQVTQGSGGVFVVKPRPAVAAKPAPPAAAPAPAQPATPVVVAAAASPTARASEGPWLLGLNAGFAEDHGSAEGGALASVQGDFFITDHVAAELAVTVPRTHSFAVPGGGARAGYRASARLQSSALSLKYYFAPESRADPYLGAGLDVTALYAPSGVEDLDRVTVGPVVEAGLEVRISPRWLLNAGASWSQVRPEVAGSAGQAIHLDPLQFDLGFAYRF